MGTYFKPLRRKFGVLTLVMACVVAAGWVRSLSIGDTISLKSHTLLSGQGYIRWVRTTGRIDANRAFDHATGNPFNWYNGRGSKSAYDWRYCGFAYGKRDGADLLEDEGTIAFTMFNYCAPYCAIVIPLTLLSAWMLLGKPRQWNSQPAQSSESTKTAVE